MSGAHVKMIWRIREVCVMGCIIQSPDKFPLCILSMKAEFKRIDAVSRIYDIEKALKYTSCG